MSSNFTNNSGVTLYYIERKIVDWNTNEVKWGSDVNWSWSNWAVGSFTDGSTHSMSGDRSAIIFHTQNMSIGSLSAGDAFAADTAIWKYGLQASNVYQWDTGNGNSHNGGTNTWLGYNGSYDDPTVPGATPKDPPKHTQESQGNITKNYILDYYKLAQYENDYETDPDSGVMRPPPLRVILGSTPYIRGQSKEQFYKITSS